MRSNPSDCPRERLHLFGEPSLSDAECLGVIVAAGRGSGAELGATLLQRFGGLAGLAAAEPAELIAHPGVGAGRAAVVAAALGLARRLAAARLTRGAVLRSAEDVALLVRETTRGDRRESFHGVYLDGRHRVLATRTISIGSLTAAPVHPREVFAPAVRAGAAAVVVAHNHPSGDPRPSVDDRSVTERLRRVGELVGIELLDHVVVGEAAYYSFADDREHAFVEGRVAGAVRSTP